MCETKKPTSVYFVNKHYFVFHNAKINGELGGLLLFNGFALFYEQTEAIKLLKIPTQMKVSTKCAGAGMIPITGS